MPNTIPMTHIDSGKTADVHPAEVDNMKAHGWRESLPAVLPPPPVSAPAPEVAKPASPDKPKLSLPNKKD